MADLTAQANFDADNARVLGIWKLVSLEIQVQGTGQMEPPLGEKPTGYAVFTPEGRAFFILTGELREPATNDEERAGLLNTLVAYTGPYRVEGDKWITNVEEWRVMPNWPDKGMTRSILSFDRCNDAGSNVHVRFGSTASFSATPRRVRFSPNNCPDCGHC